MPVDSSYSILDFGSMIADARRTDPYVQALQRSVRQGDVVVDIGTGMGIFAFLACRLGAARVYAIEPNGVIDVAQAAAAANPGSERIVWMRGISTEIELPERADVVIGDLHGATPFYNANVESLIDARERLLKPGGALIPWRDTLLAAPAEAAREYARVAEPWETNAYDVDLGAARVFACNNWWRAGGAAKPAEGLLGEPQSWGTLDYYAVQQAQASARLAWRAERAATLHGFYVWFDTETAPGIVQTNTPLLEAIAYGRGFFPVQQAVSIEPGDEISVLLSARPVSGEHVFMWDTRVTDGSGTVKASYRQNTFGATPIDLMEMRRRSATHVPEINDAGRIDLAVLAALDTRQPLGAIAERLVESHPRRFPSVAVALQYVADLSVKYSQ